MKASKVILVGPHPAGHGKRSKTIAPKTEEVTDAIITIDQRVKSKRGRTKILDNALLTLLREIPEGMGVKLEKTFGKVPAGEKRQEVSAKIRKHYLEVHGVKPSIDYTPDGIPQVFRAKKKS